MLAYEIKDKTMYQDLGGRHLYFISLGRNTPKYSGLLLESPVPILGENSNETTY